MLLLEDNLFRDEVARIVSCLIDERKGAKMPLFVLPFSRITRVNQVMQFSLLVGENDANYRFSWTSYPHCSSCLKDRGLRSINIDRGLSIARIHINDKF